MLFDIKIALLLTIEFSKSQCQVFECGHICFVWLQVFISTISPCIHGQRSNYTADHVVYFSNILEKFPFIYQISSIFLYIFQVFSWLVVSFNQPSASCPPSGHDGLLGFSYIIEVLHNFSWGSYSDGFHKNYEQIDGLRPFTFKTDSCVHLQSLTRLFLC